MDETHLYYGKPHMLHNLRHKYPRELHPRPGLYELAMHVQHAHHPHVNIWHLGLVYRYQPEGPPQSPPSCPK